MLPPACNNGSNQQSECNINLQQQRQLSMPLLFKINDDDVVSYSCRQRLILASSATSGRCCGRVRQVAAICAHEYQRQAAACLRTTSSHLVNTTNNHRVQISGCQRAASATGSVSSTGCVFHVDQCHLLWCGVATAIAAITVVNISRQQQSTQSTAKARGAVANGIFECSAFK